MNFNRKEMFSEENALKSNMENRIYQISNSVRLFFVFAILTIRADN